MGDQPPNDKKEEQVVLEPAVRSRWTPKPEQILILESIFNSGMVNPPKEETARIRSLLEKFGAVGDANVFYWFQNRRSRSRRRQRQLQAGLAAAVATSQDQHYECYQLTPPIAVGTITVFINGILSEVPRGTFDMRSMFGYNAMLVHSSGEVVPLNEYGFLMQSLKMGESYFLVGYLFFINYCIN
ncbi:hypothetical protein ZIOFF_075985 [Zingiber officinale]|uniref:Homeobox domain-containing protein n=1 Tax=Zingiber officinale TaxID=94328 RepID=A0A8J5C0G1_ZINOF|nr:hypothetical protein ZIOFF_075985 [Zingiber officinale]